MKDEPTRSLKESLKELERAYEDLEDKHTQYIEILDSDDETDSAAISTAQQNMETTYSKLVEARSTVIISKEPSNNEAKVYRALINVKKLDAPSFCGDLMQYPSFRRDYNTHMKPVYNEDPCALKKCLTGEALRAVQGIDDDFPAMMERLDSNYGRPDKLADAIVRRIKGLKPVAEGDSSHWNGKREMNKEVVNVTIP